MEASLNTSPGRSDAIVGDVRAAKDSDNTKSQGISSKSDADIGPQSDEDNIDSAANKGENIFPNNVRCILFAE